jgi:hypothetical protein
MNAQELFTKSADGTFKSTDFWYCDKCRSLYFLQSVEARKNLAENCCQPCSKCGDPTDTLYGCKKCRREAQDLEYDAKEERTWEKAEVVDSCEHGYFYEDDYRSDEQEVIDMLDEDVKEVWVFAAQPVTNNKLITMDRIIEDLECSLDVDSDYVEDIMKGIEGLVALDAAVDAFNAQNADTVLYYVPDYTKKIRIVNDEM